MPLKIAKPSRQFSRYRDFGPFGISKYGQAFISPLTGHIWFPMVGVFVKGSDARYVSFRIFRYVLFASLEVGKSPRPLLHEEARSSSLNIGGKRLLSFPEPFRVGPSPLGVNDNLQVENAILKVDHEKKTVWISTRAADVLNDLRSRFVLVRTLYCTESNIVFSRHQGWDRLMENLVFFPLSLPHVLNGSINQRPQPQTFRSEILPDPQCLLWLSVRSPSVPISESEGITY